MREGKHLSPYRFSEVDTFVPHIASTIEKIAFPKKSRE